MTNYEKSIQQSSSSNKDSAKIKKQQESVVRSVANEETQLGVLREEVKRLKVLNSNFEKVSSQKRKDIEALDSQLKIRQDKLKEIIETISEAFAEKTEAGRRFKVALKDQEKEMDDVIQNSTLQIATQRKEVRDVGKEVDVLKKTTESIQAEIKALETQRDKVSAVLFDKNNKLSFAKDDLERLDNKLEEIKNEIKEKQPLRDELRIVEKKVSDNKNLSDAVQNEIKEARRTLMEINSEKQNRLQDVETKENTLKVREESVGKREVQLDIRKENVETLAKTIQKHADKYKMDIQIWPERGQAT